MPTYRAPRGTRDLLPDERAVFDRLERIATSLTTRYGYRRIETPLFEQTAVFERGIGEVTDVVEKELFRIAPRTEEAEAWSLRPEPTAGIVRAYVQHGMQTWPQPVKLTTTGPMFRYDRPQAGRYRQFWQFDVEAIGDPGPAVDAEIIELGHRFYAEAGVTGVEVLRQLDRRSGLPAGVPRGARRRTTAATPASLPPTELDRLERNALRLLDSKDPAMAEINAAAPRITDRLCEACAAHFESVKAHLEALGVPYRVEPALVRGLDYYTRTAFEFYVAGREGQQQALGGGGRYDGLVALLGGKPTPGHRVRARPRPGRARARGAGPRRAGDATGRSRSWRARIPTTRSRGCASPPSCARRGCGSGPTSRAASSGASSRPPARTARTSR